MQAIREAISKRASGVINVVAYGYHELRVGMEGAVDAQGKVRADYLEAHRHEELEALKEWVGLLGDPLTVRFLITVVTKADLWWDREKEVIQYYSQGPYYDALGPAKTLSPVVLDYCSVFHRFYDKAPLAGTYDDGDRARAQGHFAQALLQAIAK
jgi:hypothetical protein